MVIADLQIDRMLLGHVEPQAAPHLIVSAEVGTDSFDIGQDILRATTNQEVGIADRGFGKDPGKEKIQAHHAKVVRIHIVAIG